MTKQSKAILAKYENEEFFHKEIRDSFRTLLELNEKLVEACAMRMNHDADCLDSEESFKENETCECGATLAERSVTFHKDAMKSLAGEE